MVKRVWVNGSFDVLHIGHINLLEYANSLGNVRVGLDTDERIKEKKGENRPYNILKDRIKFLSSIKYVDSIVTFSSDNELIDRIKEYTPDIMVIGDDYKNKNIIGRYYIPNIFYFSRVPNKSTSQILNYDKTKHLSGI
jgi:D-beta-D-heptose 7-phosphate kinase/D-beta-D-heptose 1-phosphate adenosyltransferase